MKYFFSTLILVCVLSACGDKDTQTTTFDRKAMLEHYADKVIQPSLEILENNAQLLDLGVQAVVAMPNAVNLDQVRNNWKIAAEKWQSANCFNFGPAGESGLRKGLAEEIGTFPADTALIRQFIQENNSSLNNFDRDTRGLYAIEYLLFRSDALHELQNNPNYRSYLLAISNHLYQNIGVVRSGWLSAYRNDFINANGTDAGSGTSALYNEFVKSFEQAKNFKVGLPAGKRPGQTQPEPTLVEAYFSGISLEVLKKHLRNIEYVYFGKDQNGANDGPGLRDYLNTVTGGPELIQQGDQQWAAVMTALDKVPTDRPLSQLMQENSPEVDALHTELQKHTRFFKSEMSSLLGIAITFSSGDGD